MRYRIQRTTRSNGETSLMMVGFKKARISQGLKVSQVQSKDTLRWFSDYNMTDVSDKMRIILSYIYKNIVVWRQ